MSSQITIKIPAFLAKFSWNYIKRILIELIQTAAIAGAMAGLTEAGNQVPAFADHYGLSPLVTAQLIMLIGAARTFVSDLNSAKVDKIPAPIATPPVDPPAVVVAKSDSTPPVG